RDANFVFEGIFGRLVRHVDTDSVYIELPAVIHTSKAAFFVAAPEQAGPAVRTKLVEQSGLPVAITKRNQVFTKQPNANGRAIRFRQFSRKQRRQPVPAEVIAHWRACPSIREQGIFFMGQHNESPLQGGL